MQPFPEHSSLSSSPLPTNSFHCDGLHELLFAAHILPFSSTCDPPLHTPVVPNDVQLAPARTITPRKRTVRKDRHSKIYTAQGPRDRRMRLSLEVARRFFDLQDMLGFDKPSKTVQWLLNKSKSAIRDVAAAVNPGGGFTFSSGSGSSSSQSSTSECQDKFTATTMTDEVNVKPQKNKRSVVQQTKKTMFNPVLAKESRAKARTRARERTREKKRLMFGTSASTIEESGSHDLKSSLELAADADEPIQNFDYHQNIITCNDMVSSFPDHWELQQFSGIYW